MSHCWPGTHQWQSQVWFFQNLLGHMSDDRDVELCITCDRKDPMWCVTSHSMGNPQFEAKLTRQLSFTVAPPIWKWKNWSSQTSHPWQIVGLSWTRVHDIWNWFGLIRKLTVWCQNASVKMLRCKEFLMQRFTFQHKSPKRWQSFVGCHCDQNAGCVTCEQQRDPILTHWRGVICKAINFILSRCVSKGKLIDCSSRSFIDSLCESQKWCHLPLFY